MEKSSSAENAAETSLVLQDIGNSPPETAIHRRCLKLPSLPIIKEIENLAINKMANRGKF
jgi:hypothetical protein